jgi:NADPH:quinone reductase-like Zn-dependent oxidoreductase
MKNVMKRWEIPSPGLSQLALREVPMPSPKRGEVLVAVEAVSLNFRDSVIGEGGMGASLQFPFSPTSDMAGRVVALGEGVTRFAIGERVISSYIANWIDGTPMSLADAPTQGGPLPGMLAQYVATPAEWCVLAPQSLSAVEASTLPVAALTAWMALVELGHLRTGQSVVIQGTGGVSLFAVQLAASGGATVIVTSSSDEKIAHAIRLGATHGVNRNKTPDWEAEVLRLTNGRGADHILEMAGGDNIARSIKAVALGGRISVIGLLESNELRMPVLDLLFSHASIVGIAVGPRRALEDLVRAIDLHGIKPVIDAVYPYTDALQAFAHLQRGAFGKIVIEVAAHG